MDYSKLSDEELEKIASGSSEPDYASMTDEELEALAGSSSSPKQGGFLSGALDAGKAALRSAGDAALFGYSPQINAAIEPVVSAMFGGDVADAKLRAQGFKVENPDYTQRRDAFSSDLAKMAEESPIASTLGGIAGAVAIPGAATTKGIAKLAPSLVKAAQTSAKARAGLAALGGGVGGLAINPGDAEGELDPLQIEERLKSAGFGTLAGLGGSYIAEKLPKVTAALKKFSKERAVKALEPMKRDLEALAKARGGSTDRVGETLLKEKVIGNMPVSREELLRRVSEKTEQSGANIGSLVESMGKLPGAESAVSRSQVASNLRDRLLTPLKGIVGTEDQVAKLDDLITRFESQGDEALSLLDAEKLKRVYQDLVKYDRKINAAQPVVEKFQEGLARQLRGQVEESGEVLAKKANNPGLASAFKAEKERFADLKSSEGILEKAQINEQARRFISPSDYGVGAAGAVAQAAAGGGLGGMATGAAFGGVNKLARQYGSQIAAKQSDNLARVLGKSESLRKAYQQDPNKVLAAYNQITGQFRKNDADQRQESKPILSEYVDPEKASKMFLDNSSF